MTQALYINDRETYALYTELAEDNNRIPMEFWEVNDNFLIIYKDRVPTELLWMTPYAFHGRWKIVQKQTKTTFAEVEPK